MDCSMPGFPVHHYLQEFAQTESMMPSNHLILCHPLLLPSSIFPSIRVFSDESALPIRWPKHWIFSFSISPSNEYSGWFPLGWTGWISLQSKGLSRVFFSTTVKKHQFFSLLYGPTLTSVIDYWKSFPLSWKLLVDKGCASLLSHCSPSATQSTVHSLIS